MALNEKKAHELIAEAEKKLVSSRGFLSYLFGSSSKIEDAIECYQGAANLFKMNKNWRQAGGAFYKAANLVSNADSRHEAAVNYVNAATCYRKIDINDAVNCLLKAIVIYTDIGRFNLAAKYHQTIAEMYETGALDLELSLQHYEQAADYFRGEGNNSSANKCLLKVAQHAARLANYQEAIEIYEQVASSTLQSSLLKYSAKEYLFRAALCHLCVDPLNAHNAMERYITMYSAFQDSRECKLVRNLIQHFEEQNVDSFTNAVRQYDLMSRLDPWYTTILLHIKQQITETPDLR